MSAFDFLWNSVQSGQIDDLTDEVKQLNEKVIILKEWIEYLEKEIKELKAKDVIQSPPIDD